MLLVDARPASGREAEREAIADDDKQQPPKTTGPFRKHADPPILRSRITVAQRKREGPITLRSVDRNHAVIIDFSIAFCPGKGPMGRGLRASSFEEEGVSVGRSPISPQ